MNCCEEDGGSFELLFKSIDAIFLRRFRSRSRRPTGTFTHFSLAFSRNENSRQRLSMGSARPGQRDRCRTINLQAIF